MDEWNITYGKFSIFRESKVVVIFSSIFAKSF